jgi:hypothetical protein
MNPKIANPPAAAEYNTHSSEDSFVCVTLSDDDNGIHQVKDHEDGRNVYDEAKLQLNPPTECKFSFPTFQQFGLFE